MLLGGAGIEDLYDKFKTVTNKATEETVSQLKTNALKDSEKMSNYFVISADKQE